MAVTASTRLGITRWSAGTDPFTRAQMDASFATLDNLAAIDKQGLLSARPAAGVRGTYYWATDGAGTLYRDNGTAWISVGAPSYGSPVASAVGDTAADGTATTLARSDHRHAREAFGAVTVYASGQASGNGTATTVARSDHSHGFPVVGGTPVTQAVGDAASAGTGTAVALANHVHGMPAFGAVTAYASAQASTNGTAATIARSDHSHGFPTVGAVAVTQAIGDAAAAGSGTTIALANHVHGMPAFGSPVAESFGATAADGTAATLARSDHRHALPAIPGKTYRIAHTFTVSGDVGIPSGDTNYIPPFFVPVPSGQTVTLTGMVHRLNSGTSATISITKNGGAITGATGISVTTTGTFTDFTDVALANDQKLELTVTAVSGSPKNMTVTLYLDYTV